MIPEAATTLPELIRAMSALNGDKPAVHGVSGSITYLELDARSAQLAIGLMTRGVGKGTRIGILYSNGPDWVVAWAAITRLGAVAVPLSTFLRPSELERVIRHADLHGLVAEPSHLRRDFIADITTAFPALESTASTTLRLSSAPHLRWIAFGGAQALPRWATRLVDLPADAGDALGRELLAAAESEVHVDEPAMMIYTSGQSAAPKGVIHSHRAVTTKAHLVRDMLGFDDASRNVATLPFFWVGGLIMTLLTTLEAGGEVECDPSRAATGDLFGGAGAALALTRYPNAKMRVGLGMTETFGIYSWGAGAPDLSRSVCPPLVAFEPGYDVKLVDAEGFTVTDGTIGEMLVRGPTVALGIHKVDREKVFDPDGFLRTGDRCERDGSEIYFVGRAGDMIKTTGANVAPAEVETELLAIEGVLTAHVVGIDDSQRGQVVGAAVVLAQGSELDSAAIIDRLSARLSSYKVPRRMVFISADEIPMTPTNKISKRELATLIEARSSPT